MKISYLLPILLVGCSGASVVKIGNNLYQITESGQPTMASANHVPDPAIEDIKNASANYCKQTNQQVKVISYDKPQDPVIRPDIYDMKFSCINEQ